MSPKSGRYKPVDMSTPRPLTKRQLRDFKWFLRTKFSYRVFTLDEAARGGDRDFTYRCLRALEEAGEAKTSGLMHWVLVKPS